MASIFRLAHVSDLHATTLRPVPGEWSSLLGKRGMGWLSWRLRRRAEYRPEIWRHLQDDLHRQHVDHVAVTGDLTHLGLASEIAEAGALLRELGPPDRVSLVPGNHDAYCDERSAATTPEWWPYLRGDAERAAVEPAIWIRNEVALIGVDTARPTRWPLASGSLGEARLQALATHLERQGREGRCRVLLLHHPPSHDGVSMRRALVDAKALQETIHRCGVELVLHGHVHRTWLRKLEGPEGPVPSVGVRAASALGRRGHRAQYHLFEIARSGRGFSFTLEIRGIEEEGEQVVRVASRRL